MERILIATKTVLNSDSVPQSINLEGSDVKLADTIENLGVSLHPTLSFQQHISSITIWNFVGFMQWVAV